MNLFRKLNSKWNHLCLLIWVKWFIYTEDVRLQAEKWTYKMNDKLKSRN